MKPLNREDARVVVQPSFADVTGDGLADAIVVNGEWLPLFSR